MACYHPLYGWQRQPGAPLQWGAERAGHRKVEIACGYCIGCRLTRARSWATRCMHETQLTERNCFVTLTYDDKHLAENGPGLHYADFQNFMRVLRRRLGYLDLTTWTQYPRFFMCGEYGDLNNRPHFHAILFGIDFNDKVPYGKNLYRSPTLERIWTKGFSTLGAATYATAGYVARYSLKKRHGAAAVAHYQRVDTTTGDITQIEAEFAHMSLKPGIGHNWFHRYKDEIFVARDAITLPGGQQHATPRYYMELLKETDPDLHDWRQYTRYINSARFQHDCTPARLAIREQCAIANEKRKGRDL